MSLNIWHNLEQLEVQARHRISGKTLGTTMMWKRNSVFSYGSISFSLRSRYCLTTAQRGIGQGYQVHRRRDGVLNYNKSGPSGSPTLHSCG